ncbi:MAG: LysM peptidoglycan-binding domain-containing protein [Anaerosomatales bacterium]
MHNQTTAGGFCQSQPMGHRRCPDTRPGHRTAPSRKAYAPVEWIGLALLVASLLVTALAIAPEYRPDEVRTRPVRVVQGDSLWTLARANPVAGLSTAETVDLLRHINGLEGSVVHAGQLLEVPGGSITEGFVAQK